MLCRVLGEETAQCRRVTWRHVPPVSRTAGAPSGLEDDAAGQGRLSELQEELETRVRESYESGLREGAAAAKAQAMAEVQTVLERLAHTIADLAALRVQVMRKAEVDLVKLSIEIARRVLRRELTVDPGALQGLVKAALEKLASQEIYRVRVHTEHKDALVDCLRELCADRSIEVIADGAQPPGTAAFEVSSGYLDASIDTQLREIERGLIDRFQGRP